MPDDITTPVDFICIPVVLSPGKTVDMWLRAASVEAFQPAIGNALGVRAYIRIKHSAELVPTSDSCAQLLAALRGQDHAPPDNVVAFPGHASPQRPRPTFDLDWHSLFGDVTVDPRPSDTEPPTDPDPNPKEPA